MGVKTGKHWFIVKRPKKSCCVESRIYDERDSCGRALYGFRGIWWLGSAIRHKNLCDPNAVVHPQETFEEQVAKLSKSKSKP